MKAASITEIKKELNTVTFERLLEICLRLAKYKKESKELLTYLLFESDHEAAYIENVKQEIDGLFDLLPKGNLYYIKKGLRKILRMVNRQIKYSGIKQTEVELRVYFCTRFKTSTRQLDWSGALLKIYQLQLKKVDAALATMPEDLQYDYQQELLKLNSTQ